MAFIEHRLSTAVNLAILAKMAKNTSHGVGHVERQLTILVSKLAANNSKKGALKQRTQRV
jgi:hypothetical protein